MKVPLLFLCAVLATAAAPAAPGEHRDRDLLVTRVTKDPAAPSGVVAFAVAFTAVGGGEGRDYFIPFLRIGQAKPRVGERCTVTWRHQPRRFQWWLADGTSLWTGRLVTGFRCGRSRPDSAPPS